jgi:hypothetical protein
MKWEENEIMTKLEMAKSKDKLERERVGFVWFALSSSKSSSIERNLIESSLLSIEYKPNTQHSQRSVRYRNSNGSNNWEELIYYQHFIWFYSLKPFIQQKKTFLIIFHQLRYEKTLLTLYLLQLLISFYSL